MYLLTVEYLDFGRKDWLLGSLSYFVLQSTDFSIISHLKSWSVSCPFTRGVVAERTDMIGVNGRNIS